jgi:hypothetical protein
MSNMEPDQTRRHESIDHLHPTDAGLMDPEGDDAPGTGIMGDETVVHDLDDVHPPGVYPAPPGPTPAAIKDEIERPQDPR